MLRRRACRDRSRRPGRACRSHRRPAQIAAVGGIADQRLVTACELLGEPGNDGLPLGALAIGFGLIAAQDIARRPDLDFLYKELGFAAHALDQQRRQRLFVVENEAADDGAAALASTENVFELALLQRCDRRGGDHATVGDDADPADMEALAQTVDHRQQHRHIGGVAGQHLGANRPALAVDDDGQDHLLQVRPMVLRVAVSPQAFAACATKRQTGRVHEDQREIAEQLAATLEQALLDQVLDAARGQPAWRQQVPSPRRAKPSRGRGGAAAARRPRRCGSRPSILSQLRSEPGTNSRCKTLAKTARSTANSKPRPCRSSPNTPAMPSRSQIRPNSNGPPMRLQATRPASISDRITARSQCRTSEAARRSSSPLASSTSLRPSARMIR